MGQQAQVAPTTTDAAARPYCAMIAPPCSGAKRSDASVAARWAGYQETGRCVLSGPIASKCFFSVSKSAVFMRGKRHMKNFAMFRSVEEATKGIYGWF